MQVTALAAALAVPLARAQATAPAPATITAFRTALLDSFAAADGAELRTLVRLAFHDCTSARCDGCVDLNDPENFGLEAAVALLDALCPQFSDEFGTADCWAAAAAMAAEEAADGALSLALYFGREDAVCEGFDLANNREGIFPSGMDGALCRPSPN